MTLAFNLKLQRTIDTPATPYVARFSPDNEQLAVGIENGNILIFRTQSGTLLSTLDLGLGVPCTAIRWRPDNENFRTKSILTAGYADGTVCQWHTTSRQAIYQHNEKDNQIFAIDYTADGTRFATAGKDHVIRVYNERTKEKMIELTRGFLTDTPGHSNRIFSLRFSPYDPNTIVSGGWDDCLYVWDIESGEVVHGMFGAHICGDSIDFLSADVVVTGSWRTRNQLQAWNLANESPTNIPIPNEPPAHQLYCCQVSPSISGAVMIAGSSNKTLQIVDTKGESIWHHLLDGAAYSLHWTPNRCVVTCSNNTVLMFTPERTQRRNFAPPSEHVVIGETPPMTPKKWEKL
ncbi:hypothetical protein PCE1_004129 [Barthelona sp. PCE]